MLSVQVRGLSKVFRFVAVQRFGLFKVNTFTKNCTNLHQKCETMFEKKKITINHISWLIHVGNYVKIAASHTGFNTGFRHLGHTICFESAVTPPSGLEGQNPQKQTPP